MSAASAPEPPTCAICMDGFNRSTRKSVACPFCNTEVCVSCVKTCLLQDNTPHCQWPSCKRPWSDDFLALHLPKTWLLKEFKVHRERILYDQEIARLPETQEDAGRYRAAKHAVQIYHEAMNTPEMIAKKQQVEDLKQRYRTARDAAWDTYTRTLERSASDYNKYIATCAPVKEEYRKALRTYSASELKTKRLYDYKTNKHYVDNYGKVNTVGVGGAVGGAGAGTAAAAAAADENRTRWTFTMRCPTTTGCEGFVGLNWKCGMCETKVCKECREVLDAEHACNPDTVASVKALTKEAKPCPKCATMISKIDGCDQMWCTCCKTAFSWCTGQIETAIVHNPHYFEYLRRTQQTAAVAVAAPAALDDHVCLTREEVLQHANQQFAIYRYGEVLSVLHVSLSHWIQVLGHVMMAHLRHIQRDIDNEERNNEKEKHKLRVMRLVKEIDDAGWRVRLQRYEKAHKKARCIRDVYDMFVTAGCDLLRQAMLAGADLEQILTQFQTLGDYTNEQLTAIGKRFNSSIPYIILCAPF
jgi:hypothetical protein